MTAWADRAMDRITYKAPSLFFLLIRSNWMRTMMDGDAIDTIPHDQPSGPHQGRPFTARKVPILFFILFGLAVTGYFALRGIRLAVISGFRFYLWAELIEYALPTLLIFAQSFVVELSGMDNTVRSFLAVGLVIAAFAVNTLGQ
jgi:hypothetical protein